MNFSARTKNEIIKRGFDSHCCKSACVSGFLRTSGSIIIKNGVVGFSAIGEVKILKFFSRIITALFSYEPEITKDKNKEQRARLEMVNEISQKILLETGIIIYDEGEISVELGINGDIVKENCCKLAFVIGAFLGSGTVTVPQIDNPTSTGYHLEFVFSQYITASNFSELFSSLDFFTKLIERKELYVVYLKNAEAVNDALTLFGATKNSLELTDIIIRKGIKNKLNRNMNCEMSNMNKSIDALILDREAIFVIEQTIGLNSLPLPLRLVANARLSVESKSLKDLADELQISKSCLSHRLRKIKEIAAELSD